jgi:hypothetical protein
MGLVTIFPATNGPGKMGGTPSASSVPHLELCLAELRGSPQIGVPHGLFEKAIEYDEKITRSDFLDLELRRTLLAIDPGIRDDRVPVTAHDRLERELDRQVELLGEQRLDAGDYSPPVHFERIRNVIAGNAKQQLDELVAQSVHTSFSRG